MPPWASALAAVAVISAVPLAATALLALNAQFVRRHLPGLVAFGAGALAGAAILHLLPHALEHASILPVGGALLAGYGAFAIIERLLGAHDHAHAHGIPMGGPTDQAVRIAATPGPFAESRLAATAADPGRPAGSARPAAGGAGTRSGAHTRRSLVPLNFFADATHNLVDGVLVAAAFLVDSSLGLATMFAVALHELPREVGTYAVFVHSGVTPRRAVLFNFVTGLIAMGGASLTLLAGSRVRELAEYVLPFAAGTYLFIALAVGREALRGDGESPFGRRAGAAVLGFVAMALGIGAL